MKLADVQSRFSEKMWFSPIPGPVDSGLVGSLGYLDQAGENTYLLRICGTQTLLAAVEKRQAENLACQLRRGLCCLAELLKVARDGRVQLHLVFFNGGKLEMGEVHLAVPGGIDFPPGAEERFVLRVPVDGEGREACYCAVCDAALMHEPEDDAQPQEPQAATDGKRFVFLGGDARLYTEMHADGMRVVRLAPASRRKVLPFLCRCDLKICSSPVAPPALLSVALGKVGAHLDQYLELWDRYGKIEGEAMLGHARKIGSLRISSWEACSSGCKLFTDAIPETLDENDALELVAAPPVYLERPGMTFQEYLDFLTADADKTSSPISSCNILNIDRPANCILTDWEGDIPKGFMAVLSIRGDNTQIKRRHIAREKVKSGRSANPFLGNIIEGESYVSRDVGFARVPALSPFVSQKLFSKNPPTPRQEEAIGLALNTPDIMLIQGPPGTGKTTVITAIIERLNELADKSVSQRGEVLVSAVQHDAVDNILSRLSVNMLPPVKFGGRRRNGEASGPLAEEDERIDGLVRQIARDTRSRNPQLGKMEEASRLQRLADTYLRAPTRTNMLALLSAIEAEPRMPRNVREHARDMLDKQRRGAGARRESPEIVRRIRALRCSEVSFCDDGTLQAQLLLDELEAHGELGSRESALLSKAAAWFSATPPPFLAELRELRTTLLDRYLPRPEFGMPKLNGEVESLANDACAALREPCSPAERRNALLARFLFSLECDPDAMRDALKEYNFVYGATTQQCEGKEIHDAKRVERPGKHDEDYDTVIIDEAARCSPRDLIIPMVKARRRIILVGDHRQLPHIVEDEYIRRLEEEDTGASTGADAHDLLKTSMFEYMRRQLKKMEAVDGIKRTITLDAQYRMHPLLGNFVSDEFYAKDGESFGSPLPAEHFRHGLPGIEGKAAVWVDVPADCGDEGRTPAGSRFREPEAEAVAELLWRYMSSEQGQGLTFGVISFYKQQADLIRGRLVRDHPGIVEESLDKERLRIGTVDSFQGMEFDVVFLSAVRCRGKLFHRYAGRENAGEAEAARLFGHLMSANRLCVSMSRQKRCLVLVGDAGMFETPLAREHVGALARYLSICRREPQGLYMPYERS